MSVLIFANNAISTLAVPITSTATSISVAAGTGSEYPTIVGDQYFLVTINDASTGLLKEILKVTAISGDSLTVVRGQEGTTPLAWNAGDRVSNMWTAASATLMLQQGQAQFQTSNYAPDTGTQNAYVATYDPPIAAHTVGTPLRVKIANTCNGASTFNPGPGVKPIVNQDGSVVLSGQIIAGSIYEFIYDGTSYQFSCVALKASTALDNLTSTAAPVVQSLVSNNGAGGTFVFNPYGQVVAAKANILVDQSVTDATGTECFLAVNIDCNIPTTGDKVGIYAAMNVQNGTSDVWAFNSLIEIAPGNVSSNGAWSYEADVNNFSRHTGETLGPSGMGTPIYRGIGITGYSTYRCTAAVTIDSNNIDQWNRGFVAAAGSVVQSAFADYSNGAISLDIWGSHTNGIDMSNATISGNILKGPNNFSINAAGQIYFGDLQYYTSIFGGNPALNWATDGYMYYDRGLSKLGLHVGGKDTLGILADQVAIYAARLSQSYGTPGAGAPSGNWAAELLNYVDTDGENGLVIGNHFATNTNRVLSAGSTNDGVYGGSFKEFFAIGGAGGIFSEALQSSTSYADDTAAAAGGISIGQFYRNGSVAQIRIS